MGRRGAPGSGGGGGAFCAPRSSAATAGTWPGGFQSPSFSFQMWTSAFFAQRDQLVDQLRASRTARCASPSSAMYHCDAVVGGGDRRQRPGALAARGAGGANASINIGFGASIVRSDSCG